VRSNSKKRLGICGGLTLLCVTVVSGALVSPAGAQVATGQLDVTVHLLGTFLQPDDFSFQVNGGTPIVWPPNGTAILTGLPTDVTYTVTPVPHDGFTATVTDDIPGIHCTDVTLDPATPAFCLVTFASTTTTTTTTSTSTTSTSTTLPTTTTTIVCSKPGWGYSDKNHNHCGAPGRQRIRAQLIGASGGGSPDTGIFVTAIALATALTVLWPRKRSRLRSQQ
jgi:hypothetical protein